LESTLEVGLRERKKIRTHTSIAQAALQLFAERGYDATPVDDIAAAGDVSPRTFFRYFPTKEHVVFANSEQVLERLLLAIRATPPDVPDAIALREGFLALAVGIEHHRTDNLLRGKLIAENPSLRARAFAIETEWEAALADELAERSGKRTRVDRDGAFARRSLVSSGLGANRIATEEWSRRGGRGSLTRLISLAFSALIEQYALAAISDDEAAR
jgi:AcrR family transcriptional regulator